MTSESTRPARLLGEVTIAVGVGALVGWTFDIEVLKSIHPRFVVILPFTALCMVIAGASLLFCATATERATRYSRVLAAATLLLGTVFMVQRVFEVDLGINQLLFPGSIATYPFRPLGLMATNSTVSLVLGGVALLLMTGTRVGYRRIGRRVAVLGLGIAGLALLGHAYGAKPLYAIDRAAGMGLLTAVGFAALFSGITIARPGDEGISLVTGKDLAASLVRRVLPVVLVLPVAAGFFWLVARDLGLFGHETGVALAVIGVVASISALLWRAARALRVADAHRTELLDREREARAAADVANKAKTDFLAVMSHELRTPLNAIVGYEALLRDGIPGPVTPEQRNYLERIRRSAAHLGDVVDQILTLSRIDAGKLDVATQRVDVKEVLTHVAALLERTAATKGLALVVEAPEPIVIESDESKLCQILINLGANAIKFTPKGTIILRAHRDDGAVVIEVADTGIGIAPENQEKIFEDFWQVESPMTRQAGGTGLGLAVSRRLARLLDGDIQVASTLGRGSLFTLRLRTGDKT